MAVTSKSESLATGTVNGHLQPGVFLCLFGLWWILRISQLRAEKYANSKRYQDKSVWNKLTRFSAFPIECCGVQLPLESVYKMIAAGLVMKRECNYVSLTGRVGVLHEWQHLTLAALFLFVGIMEIFTFYGTFGDIPVDYAANILFFTLETFNFYYHNQHQDPYEQIVHGVLLGISIASAVSFAAEMLHRDNLELKYIRPYFVILQGTYFIQIGYMLYQADGHYEPWVPPGVSKIQLYAQLPIAYLSPAEMNATMNMDHEHGHMAGGHHHGGSVAAMVGIWIALILTIHCVAVFTLEAVVSTVVWAFCNGIVFKKQDSQDNDKQTVRK